MPPASRNHLVPTAWRHAGRNRRVLTRQPCRDRCPEPSPVIASLPPAVDLATTMAAAQIDPNAASDAVIAIPPSRCCDDWLKPTQYTSLAFGRRCREAGVRPSMGSVGDAYDNAMCESFFATLECELLARRRFGSQAEARMAVFRFIEGWSTIRPGSIPPSAIYRQLLMKRRCS